MIRRDAYDEVGGFDEQFYPAWYEDVDFCERVKAKGWDIYFARNAEFLHEGGYSAAAMGAPSFLNSYYGNQVRYARKHFSNWGMRQFERRSRGHACQNDWKAEASAAYGKAFIRSTEGMSRVAVNIVTFNSARDIAACLESLRQQTFRAFEIHVLR
jgi:GT2 family glycosyltransferase